MYEHDGRHILRFWGHLRQQPSAWISQKGMILRLLWLLPQSLGQTKNWIRKLNQENQERGPVRETWELGRCPRLHIQLVPPRWLHFTESPITSHRPAWLTPPPVTWIMFILGAEPLTPSLQGHTNWIYWLHFSARLNRQFIEKCLGNRLETKDSLIVFMESRGQDTVIIS